MQSEQVLDQADGLRRLLMRPSLRVITVVGARTGMGATSVVASLAFALARQDRQVLVLDENQATDNVASRLQLKPRYDLLHTVSDHMRVRSVMLHASARVHVLPVARAIQSLSAMDGVSVSRLLENFNAAMMGMDVVLVDAATSGYSICSSLPQLDPLLMVMDATSDGITSSYAMLKQMALQHGRKNFSLLINRVKEEVEARTVFENIAEAAQRYLAVRLEYAGSIPETGAGYEYGRNNPHLLDGNEDVEIEKRFTGLAKRLLQPVLPSESGNNTLHGLMARLVHQKSVVANRKAA